MIEPVWASILVLWFVPLLPFLKYQDIFDNKDEGIFYPFLVDGKPMRLESGNH